MATRAGLAINTVRAVEAGAVAAGMGAYASVLWALGLLPDLEQIAAPAADHEGLVFDLARHGRRAVPPVSLSNDF